MELLASLLTFFGLPHDVRARDVGITEIDCIKVHPEQKVCTVFCDIPMGWTLSGGMPKCPRRFGSASSRS